MLSLIPGPLRLVLASLLWPSNFQTSHSQDSLQFELRHVHALSNHSRNIFADVPSSVRSTTYSIPTRQISTHKASSHTAFASARFRSVTHGQSEALSWLPEPVVAPDVERRETLLTLAKMTANAYTEKGAKDWMDLGPDWNSSYSYGWEPDADGFRGHVFVSTDETTVVVSIKGTSIPILVGGPTIKKDKLNDNLLFSCCCAKVGPTWSTVCGCHQGGYKCESECVERSLIGDSLFYTVGTNLYNNITHMYPEANIWLIGHSMGGAVASLLGATFGAPVVAFEAPGERMASKRLHLPSPPSLHHITHVFNTGDPIPLGQCTGVSSWCASGGYAMESQCHLGKIIRYDTVKQLGWSSNVIHHPIKHVIDNLLVKDWEVDKNGTTIREVPEPVDEDPDCQDCFRWDFV